MITPESLHKERVSDPRAAGWAHWRTARASVTLESLSSHCAAWSVRCGAGAPSPAPTPLASFRKLQASAMTHMKIASPGPTSPASRSRSRTCPSAFVGSSPQTLESQDPAASTSANPSSSAAAHSAWEAATSRSEGSPAGRGWLGGLGCCCIVWVGMYLCAHALRWNVKVTYC